MNRQVDSIVGFGLIFLVLVTVWFASDPGISRWLVALEGGCVGWLLALIVEAS